MKTLVFTVLAVLLLALAPRDAHADSPEWKPNWPKFRPAEIALTTGLTVQVAQASFLFGDPKRNWEGGVLFDDSVRDRLRLHSRGGRNVAATTSDMMYYALVAYPLVDAPLVGGIRGDGDVAVQTMAINLESYALAGAVAMTGEKIGRARPMAAECDQNPGYDRRCGETGRNNASFVSGHTAIAFTGAGLTCVHHLHMPIYGGGAPDVAACAATMTLATASGVLRILSDNHYATDVMLGAGIGLASGYLVPRLLHYGSKSETRSGSILPTFRSHATGMSVVLSPTVGSSMTGLVASGTL